MTILLCISDLSHRRQYCEIDNNNNVIKLPKKDLWSRATSLRHASANQNTNNARYVLRRLLLEIEGIAAFYLIREIQQFTQFRLLLCANPALRGVDVLWLQLRPPAKEIIDYVWGWMVSRTLWEHIEVEYLMSWLSTLGGGYSALGEQFTKCAQVAGRISLRQLNIGLRLGDPFLQARCKLYYSISLIQTGKLRQAKYILRDQYAFAITQKELDGRLVKMCEGIWLRLQYEYRLRLKRRERSIVQHCGAGDK